MSTITATFGKRITCDLAVYSKLIFPLDSTRFQLRLMPVWMP